MPKLSPDNKTLLVSLMNPRTHTSDVWSLDLQQGAWRRQSFRDAPGVTLSAWSGDGRRFIYSSFTGKESEMYLKTLGDGSEGTLLQTGLRSDKSIADWSRDRKFIIWQFSSLDVALKDGYYGQSLDPAGKPFLLVESKNEDDLPRFSPDGHWIAYLDERAGNAEVYVRRFTSESAASVQVSIAGGHNPRWSRDGGQLFYHTDDWTLMTVPLSGIDELRFGKPEMLFHLPRDSEYDVSNDNRFLVVAPTGRLISPVQVIVNWRPETVTSP